jgi:hypothetical protein
MNRMFQILVLGSVLLSIQSSYAIANTLGRSDLQTVDDLGRKTLVLGRDIVATSKAAVFEEPGSRECFSQLVNQINNMYYPLSTVSILIDLSSSVVAAYDETIINSTITREVKYGISQLALTRDSVNYSIGSCPRSALVTAKGGEMLRLIGAIENALRRIGQRVAP